MGEISDMFVWFNYVEGLFWIVLGVGVLFRYRKAVGAVWWAAAVGGAILCLFGVSDFVEAHTGAWYRPLALLLWKAGCLAGIAGCLAVGFKAHKKRKIDD